MDFSSKGIGEYNNGWYCHLFDDVGNILKTSGEV